MNKEILFSETQRFKQWWLWIILIGVNVLMFYGVYSQVIEGHQFGDKPMNNSQILIGTGISLSVTFFILSFRLGTQIKSDGIYVRLFPLQFSYKFFPWNSLLKCYVRKYNAIAEFGGWGLRLGLFGKGTAYNISGNKGLQLEFTNGKKLLIGTQKTEELTEVIEKSFLP
ncbi:MAG TPA: hypothetical protein VN722_03900 [Hanamia sp.]|nr:hypothetical protein [Hanamia sp.]